MSDTYPTIRDLDGMHFRIKRGDRWVEICFTDMTDEERKTAIYGHSAEFMREFALCLAERLREVGDELDIVGRLCVSDDRVYIRFESMEG